MEILAFIDMMNKIKYVSKRESVQNQNSGLDGLKQHWWLLVLLFFVFEGRAQTDESVDFDDVLSIYTRNGEVGAIVVYIGKEYISA